jgi:hypothetical protein
MTWSLAVYCVNEGLAFVPLTVPAAYTFQFAHPCMRVVLRSQGAGSPTAPAHFRRDTPSMAMGAMKNPSKLLSSFKMLAFCALLSALSAAQDAPSTIRAEIARLQQSLKNQPITDPDLKEINSMVGDG